MIFYFEGKATEITVTDQGKEPFAAWGQMLPRFFKPGIAIANHAESGESLKSFVAERRLAKIASTIRKGDYLFIQFTHNDQKPGASHAGKLINTLGEYPEAMRQLAKAESVVLIDQNAHSPFDPAKPPAPGSWRLPEAH